MCGICGQVRTDGRPADASAVSAMGRVLGHRGPDGSGLWEGPGVALGHRRLSILDLTTAGAQPMTDPTGRYVMVYNGEVYNYLELARELEAEGFSFSTRTDTEVVLAAYARWGPECVARFNGMFALALWDRRERRLFCCRDRLGIKPFYYVYRDGVLWFASEIKALTAAGAIRPEPDDTAVYDYLAFCLMDHEPSTFLAQVRQLAPGCRFVFSGAEPGPERYWSLPEARPAEGRDFAAEFAELFDDSVRLRMRSDVPVAVLLSGGLDSSSVAASAALAAGGRPPVCFTSSLAGQGLDETGFAAATAQHIRAEHVVLHPDSHAFWTDLGTLLYHHDGPTHASDVYANWALMRRIGEQGVKVLLNGQGGDEILAGYNWYVKNVLVSVAARGRLDEFLRLFSGVRKNFPNTMTQSRTRLLAYVAESLLPDSWRVVYKPELSAVRRVLRPAFRRAMRGRDVRDLGRTNAPTLEGKTANDLLYFNIPRYLHYEDRNSMAFGIEQRVPFLDHRIVEWSRTVPARAKMAGGRPKDILRRAFDGRLPRMVLDRQDKMGLSICEKRWFSEDLAREFAEFFDNPSAMLFDRWVDRSRFAPHLRAYVNGRPTPLGAAMWRFFCLEKWVRQELDGSEKRAGAKSRRPLERHD